MPKLTLHPLSVVIGLAIAGLVALTTSQAAPPPATLVPAAIRIEYMPHPRDMVQIKEGTPYTVPAGKLFVLTGLGRTVYEVGEDVTLTVNGLLEVHTSTGTASRGSCSMETVPHGFTVQAGSTITLQSGLPAVSGGRAWGYLASQ